MNTDNDGSSNKLMPLEDLTIAKLNSILNRIKLYQMASILKSYNLKSFQRLQALKIELDLFEHSLASAIMQGLISEEDADKRGFETDYILTIFGKYVVEQEQKVKKLAI